MTNVEAINERSMDSRKYIPQPMDTSAVELPEELTSLVEQMAKNVHDVWAQGRINAGWTYGAVRDDAKKTHPCLVPYDELPESEKEYDRNSSVETLKLIMKSGFKIIRN
jgi:ryanodine receptor 2